MRSIAKFVRGGEPQANKLGRGKLEQRIDRTTPTSALSRCYYAIRIYLHNKRWLLRSVQRVRGWWILGPLRVYAVHYYQRFHHNTPIPVEKGDVFLDLDVEQVVDAVNEQGYASGVQIHGEYVTQILHYCDNTKLVKYWNPHKECEAIDRLARDSKVVDIARRYLGAEPILWLTQPRWSFGDPMEQREVLSSLHPEPVQYDSDAFHYDTLDFKSLTIFIYLTDVGPESGPHVVIENSHKTKSFNEICHIILSDTMAQKKIGDRIKMILGPKGTVFF